MKLYEILDEAISLSQAKKYTKAFNRERYKTLFQKYTTDPKAYRIYIPLEETAEKIKAPPEIEDAVIAAGYQIEDYRTGIASSPDGKRRIKIGKLLKDEQIRNKFANDPVRSGYKNEDALVVISRHPVDIAGMSTDRGWTSCMDLKDSLNNKHYIIRDVVEGSIIAYQINSTDLNIKTPSARILIKPFVNVDNKNDIILGHEDKEYGVSSTAFKKTIINWLTEVNGPEKFGVYELNRKLYQDSYTSHKIFEPSDGVEISDETKESIHLAKNPFDFWIKNKNNITAKQVLRILSTQKNYEQNFKRLIFTSDFDDEKNLKLEAEWFETVVKTNNRTAINKLFKFDEYNISKYIPSLIYNKYVAEIIMKYIFSKYSFFNFEYFELLLKFNHLTFEEGLNKVDIFLKNSPAIASGLEYMLSSTSNKLLEKHKTDFYILQFMFKQKTHDNDKLKKILMKLVDNDKSKTSYFAHHYIEDAVLKTWFLEQIQ